MKLENKQIGALIAFILAVIMLFLPGPDKSKYSFDPEILSKIIMEREDHISPSELSEWIIEGNNDYQLIDIRTEKEYKKGHIKNSINIPILKLLLKKTIEQELSAKQLLLYSNGNSHAHQAWLILKTAGIDALVLEGGYNHWNERVLNPKMPKKISDDEILRYRKQIAVANYFGSASGISPNSSENVPVKTKKRRRIKKKKKKKLEGC